MSFQILNMERLTITIPKYDINIIEEKLRFMKQTLVYLETPNCRKYMEESVRRDLIRSTTEKFRRALHNKSLV
jgi:hypothetical protein